MSSAAPAPPTDRQLQSVLDSLEDRFADLHRQITTLQRLAALGTASATLAHEFNNILTPVLSYCQFALQNHDPELMKTAVEKTAKNIARLTGLCSRIMNMAAGNSGDVRSVVLLALITDAVECLGRDLKKDDIHLTIEVPENLTAVIDPAALHQVLFNLLLNARQAMLGRTGSLTIRAARVADRIQIDISDTGPGIPPENRQRIFEPFFTTRSNPQGAGLGLHVCRQLMEEINGEIALANSSAAGTTFRLTLPII